MHAFSSQSVYNLPVGIQFTSRGFSTVQFKTNVPSAGRAARILMSLLRVGTPEFWSIYGYLGIKSSGQRAQKGSRAPMGEIPKPRSYMHVPTVLVLVLVAIIIAYGTVLKFTKFRYSSTGKCVRPY